MTFRVIFVVCLAIFFVLWLLLSWRNNTRNNNEFEDRNLLFSFERRRILVVIQFPPHQWELARENFMSWDMFFPCRDAKDSRMVDLVLYVSNDPEGDLEKRVLSFVGQQTWRKCFSRVLFKSCELAPQEDVYGVGTVTMFYRMFDRNFVPNFDIYDYSFLMEPDARPIRKYWLDELEKECSGNLMFWQKGSLPRYTAETFDLHINGNAIYRVNDEESTRFFLESKNAFLPYISFDQSIYAYRTKQGLQNTAHLFVATEFIVNNWRGFDFYSIHDVLQQLPNTFIMHGKQAVKAVNTLVNCTNCIFGKMSKIGS